MKRLLSDVFLVLVTVAVIFFGMILTAAFFTWAMDEIFSLLGI